MGGAGRGLSTFTTSAVYGGLTAAAQFADAFGETSLAQEYRDGAASMRQAMDKYLFLDGRSSGLPAWCSSRRMAPLQGRLHPRCKSLRHIRLWSLPSR